MTVRVNQRSRLVLMAAIVVFSYNFVVAWHEAARPEGFAVAYLGLSAFVGSYNVLYGQPAQPSPGMALGLSVALIISFGAAISVLLRLSRSGIARWSTSRRKGGVVVIGSSPEADAIARSLAPEARRSLIRIREDGPTEELGSIVVPNWQGFGDDRVVSRMVSAASNVVVAGSTDAVSARWAAAVRPLMGTRRPFQLVRSAQLARALRPDVLTALPESEGFHPADNVGQLIASVIAAHARAGSDRVRIAFKVCGDDPMAEAVRVWITNTARATSFVTGTSTYEIVSQGDSAAVCVLAGAAEAVAAEAARRSSGRAVVAAASADLIGSVALPAHVKIICVTDWLQSPSHLRPGQLVIVDPERDGLRFNVVADGLEAQWGRAFHDAYASLYRTANPGPPADAWSTDLLGRSEQSSIGAVKYMLEVLRKQGYELKAGDAGWAGGQPASNVVDAMARMEHDEWWQRRTWVDEAGVERRVSLRQGNDGVWQDGPNSVNFNELDPAAQAYNRDVITKVYPALAAMFGYGIRRAQAATGS